MALLLKPPYTRFDNNSLNGRFVVKYHLRFDSRLALCRFTLLDQFTGIEPGVGIPLQMTRCPRQVNQ